MIYSWHTAQWQQITSHWAKQPNAWLFTGKEHTGKTAFARHVANALLCEQPSTEHEPCGQCPSCHLFTQNSHPDLYELTPEIPEGEVVGRKLLQIKIDTVRALIGDIYLSSVRGGRRVVLVHPAESMNTQAANGLLKVLEEPPADVIFLLVTHSRDKLLPTIKSRCRQMVLPAPSYEDALGYLKQQHTEQAESLLAFHGGAPLFEHDPAQDSMRNELTELLANPRLLSILDYATAFDKQKWPLAVLLDWLHKWLFDITLSQQKIAPLYYPNSRNDLNTIAAKTEPATLFALTDTLKQLTPYGHHTLTVKLHTESLLIDYLNFWQRK